MEPSISPTILPPEDKIAYFSDAIKDFHLAFMTKYEKYTLPEESADGPGRYARL